MVARGLNVAAGVAAILAAAGLAMLASVRMGSITGTQGAAELLLKMDLESHEPYSPPANMYLWWGPTTNHRFAGSGEHIRHLLNMGQIEGGEWRDRMFLGNNGVATFRGQRFRRISETCCSTIVVPPMEWDFPVYNIHKVIGQRIRNFVANGNMLVLTGGILSVEFINSYFFENLELADGNYSPGPYRRLDDVPVCLKAAPSVLPQKGISVTAVKKESLPSGTEVLWGTPRSSPVFMIKFCEAQSPNEGMPPVKVLPRDCPAAEAEGRPCSCGYVMYIGYNYQEPYPSRWDKVLLSAVEIMSPTYVEPEGGYKAPNKKLAPGTPPCLQKGGGDRRDAKDAGAGAAQALRAAVGVSAGMAGGSDVAVETSAARHVQGVRGRGAGGAGKKLRAAETKLQLQQQEINSLETEVAQLKTARRRAGRGGSVGAKAARVTALAQQEGRSRELGPQEGPSMAVLRARAARLMSQIHQREAVRAGRGRGDERVLVASMTKLAEDMHKINTRVNSLTQLVEKKEAPDGEHATKKRAQSGAAKAELAQMEAQVHKYKKEARAAKQELRFEQSVPSAPTVEYSEPDHTTPLFGQGGRHCGTLCKLKGLVKQTRSNIAKELNAAMHD